MPLTLVTGRANSGKTGVLHDIVRTAGDRETLPVLVVPGTADARLAREEFAITGAGMGVRVATFDELLTDLWRRFGDGREIATDSQRRCLIGNTIELSDLVALRASSDTPGFRSLLAELAQSLAVEPDPRLAHGSGAGREVLRILANYLHLLEESGLTEGAQAARILSDGAQCEWFDGPVAANRFADLTPSQEQLLIAIAAAGIDVYIALPWERDFAATRALDPLVARLVVRGAALSPVKATRHTSSDEIAYLESHLFRDPAEALGAPCSGDVRLSEACGEEAEADRIACEVLEALGAGVEPSRVGVVFRDPQRHVRAVVRAFAEAGIDANYDVLVSAHSTGFGRALAHLLGYVAEGGRTDLIAFLRTPYSGVESTVCERLERRWRGSRTVEPSVLDGELRRHDRTGFRTVESARRAARAPIDATTVNKWQHLAGLLLQNAYGTAAPCLDGIGRADAAAHRALCRMLDELTSLEHAEASAKDLVDGLAMSRVPLDAEEVHGRVQVLSAHRARSRRFDVLIVGGLTDGDFPSRARDDALSPTEIARVLEASGLNLRRLDEQDTERLLFYLVVSRATTRLVLSRQVADSEGRPLRASWLLEELLDLYRTPGDSDVRRGQMPPLATLGFDQSGLAPGAPETLRRSLRTAAAMGAIASGRGAASQRLADARRRAASRSPSLSHADALEFLARERPYSATEIEAYLGCPYAWFHDRVVRAEGIDGRIDALAQGALMHDALHSIYAKLSERTGSARVTPQTVPEALSLASEVLKEVIRGQATPVTFAEEAALVAVRRQVRGFVEADADFLPEFAPVALEYGFGRDEPVEFDGFALVGRIDRIDADADGALAVSDYKKRARIDAAHGQAKFIENGRVQLALYARVVEKRLGKPVAGAFYRGVSGRNVIGKHNRGFFDGERTGGPGLVRTDRLGVQEIQTLMDEAERLAREAVHGMRSGDIPARPRTKKACDYCTVRRVCPSETR